VVADADHGIAYELLFRGIIAAATPSSRSVNTVGCLGDVRRGRAEEEERAITKSA
jgi:hypothetical protein